MFVRTHDVVRIGLMVRSKYVVCSGSFVRARVLRKERDERGDRRDHAGKEAIHGVILENSCTRFHRKRWN